MPNLILNGDEMTVSGSVKTIRDLVLFLKKSPEHVVVECGGEVFKGVDTDYVLKDGDAIEVVHFVGGGTSTSAVTWVERDFVDAQTAMDHDRQLAETLSGDERRFCLYTWGQRGVTYGFKQDVPDGLVGAGTDGSDGVEGGRRATGGGIVFHNPGDLVIACAAPLTDPTFPSRLHDKMAVIRDLFIDVFSKLSIPVAPRPEPPESDDPNWKLFCSSYPNPYELFYENEKILALTLRRFKTSFLIQGIIHLHNNHQTFNDFPHYNQYFSAGLPDTIRPAPSDVQRILRTVLNERFA